MRALGHKKCAPLGSLSLLLCIAACTFDTSTRAGPSGDGGAADANVVDATNEAPVADPQLVIVVEDVPKAITLTGTDPEGAALSFSILSGPSVGTLSGTPPDLIYTPGLLFNGVDSFMFSVTDSVAQVASATVDISVVAPAPAIYEPFDYTAGDILGKSSLTEIGLLGAWSSSQDAQQFTVVLGSLSQGPLSVTGGHLLGPGAFNRFGGDRPIDPIALTDSGLLTNGSVLWFSAMIGLGASVNQTNSHLDFALATAPFGLGNLDRFIQVDGATAGSGVGFTLFRGTPRAAEFGVTAPPLNDVNATPTFSENQNGLIVGKISWGATNGDADTVELFQPNTDLSVLGTAISTLQMTVDQSTFDTMTMHRGERVVIDEIRFGPSLSSVLLGP